MEKNDYFNKEKECQMAFGRLGNCWHLCTGENAPVIFHDTKEFMTGMNIIAFTSGLFPKIDILTFEIMSNHLHFALSGTEEDISMWFDDVLRLMKHHPDLMNSRGTISNLDRKLIPVSSLENIRNVICYINKNASVVMPDESPFNYPWGANRFYFNREAKLRHLSSKKFLNFREKRLLSHSEKFLELQSLFLVDGYISPLCFCGIENGEMLFRNEMHYFSKLSRNLAANKEIADLIGENLYYTDDDLFAFIISSCNKKYDGVPPASLLPNQKMELARTLHFSYNANEKQIARLLKLDLHSVGQMLKM